jgi:hypothetical protein
MLSTKGKATVHETMAKPTQNALANKSYSNHSGGSSEISIDRQAKIAERLAAMPRKYRAGYKRAVKGKSLRSAVNAQCLECVYWQRKEVTLCTDTACPLWAVRPYRNSGSGHDGGFTGAESKKSGKGDNRV